MGKVSRLQKVYVLMVITSFVMQTVAPALVFAAEETTPVTTVVVTPEPVVALVTTELVTTPVVTPQVTPPVVAPPVATPTPVVEVTPVAPQAVPVSPAQIVVSDLPAPEVEFEVNSLRSHDSDLLKDFTGVVRQAKPYYCGPAALATVFGQMGKDVDQEKIADISVMDEEKGTTLYGLEQATKAFGFIPVAKKWDIETLKQYLADTDAPVIIHDIKSNEGHFTVVREITEAGIVELSDTEAGNIAVDVKTFEHAWTNDVLVVVDKIDHPLLADESTNISDAVAKTIWGTYVLVAIGDEFSDAELRNLHYCILNAEKISNSTKQKDAKKKCYKAVGASLVDKSDTKILEKYGFSGMKNKESNGTAVLVNSEEANNLLDSILSADGNVQDIYDDIHDLEDSVKSKKNVLKKVDDKLEGMQNQLIRLDKDYKATKSSLKKASSKKQKELKKDLDKIEKKQKLLEAQIAAEKRRISGEMARLNKEVSQIERNITLKRSAIASKESSIKRSVTKLKSLYDVQSTDAVIYNDVKEKYDGYIKKLQPVARFFEVAEIISPVSVFDLCSAATGKDCVSDEGLNAFDKTLVAGSLIPFGGKFFKAAKVAKNGKKILEVVEVVGDIKKIQKIGDIFSNPSILKDRMPEEISELAEKEGWRIEQLSRGSQEGEGLIVREVTKKGDLTGRMIQWHPGDGHHGPDAYWKVSSADGGVQRVGPQF